uniref:Signal recognition particle subunit SRP68 n=1 Tax=Theileria annulata TaxID=5874 RepID=A0A3B0MXP7_THEAN
MDNPEVTPPNLSENLTPTNEVNGVSRLLKFPVLDYVNEVRFKRGIKLEEYGRFRKYCSRKLHQLRKQFKSVPNKSGKYIHEEFPEVLNDNRLVNLIFVYLIIRYLEIVTLRCERAWSYAMDLKSKCETSTLKNNRGRHYYMRKFGKAYRLSVLLEDYSKKFADNSTISASKLYHNFFEGVLRYEQGRYEEGYSCLTTYSSVIEQKIRTTAGLPQCEWYNSQLTQLNAIIKMCTFHMKVMGKVVSTPTLSHQTEDANAELIQVKTPEENHFVVHCKGVAVPLQSQLLPQKILYALNSIDKLSITDTILTSLCDSTDIPSVLREHISSKLTKDQLLNNYEEVTVLFNECVDDVCSELMLNTDGQDQLRKLEDTLHSMKSLLQVEKHVILEIFCLYGLCYNSEFIIPYSCLDNRTPLPDSSEGIRYANMLKQQLTNLVDDPNFGTVFLVPKEIVRTVNALLLSIHCFRKEEFNEGMSLINWANSRSLMDISLPEKQKNRLLWRCLVSFKTLQSICNLVCKKFYQRLLVLFARKNLPKDAENEDNILDIFGIERDLVYCRPLLFDLAFIYYQPPELETGSRFKGKNILINYALGVRNMLSSLWN